jgi:ferredoxin
LESGKAPDLVRAYHCDAFNLLITVERLITNQIEIYYFSGTGNSLHVARELQKRIPDTNLIPIVSLLHEDAVTTNGETVGFVFPIYLTALPLPVTNFIKKLDLNSATYIFALATRSGSPHRAFVDIEKILKKSGKSLDSYFTLNMGTNYLDPIPTQEEIAELESIVQDRLDSIQHIIINKEKDREKDTDVTAPLPFGLLRLYPLLMALAEFAGLKHRFYSDSKCTGCGTCERVCLSQKITMTDKKPVWQENVTCYMCYACLNFCPVRSVQLKSTWYMKSHTHEIGRYSHPYATALDVAGEKEP